MSSHRCGTGWYDWKRQKVGLDEAGEFLQTHCMMYNITESKRAEELIKASLNEKSVLLQEIHHRVKNNMQVVPCGLIVNELLTNIITQAFANGGRGHIKISLRPADEKALEMVVSDDGVGLPEGLLVEKSETVGLTIVNALLGQVAG